MPKLKENKAFQTIVGGAVLYLLFILWRDGWIDAILRRNEDPEGFEGPEVWIAVGQALLSFVQLVDIVTIGIVSGVLPHLESMLEFLGKQIKSLLEQAKVFVAKNKDAEPGEQWNWKPLAAIREAPRRALSTTCRSSSTPSTASRATSRKAPWSPSSKARGPRRRPSGRR